MYSNQTPIDIPCSKLVDWLIQRRHCKKDWGVNLASVKRKIRAALRDMPENQEIKELLIGSKLDYSGCKRIVEILKTTEASSKNIFGFYSSQRMKDWQEIVNMYERDNIHLAEIATDLIRENSYEVPGIRKVVGKLNRDKDEAEKHRSNLLRRAQIFRSEYQKLAASYGIQGDDVESELNEKSQSLSSVLEEVARLSKGLEQDMQYYREFAKSTSKQSTDGLLANLQKLLDQGKAEANDWKRILNDLLELEAFYNQTSHDQINTSDNRLGATASRLDANELSNILQKIRQIIDIFSLDQNKVLFQINDSETFVENIIEKFASKSKQIEDVVAKAETLSETITDIDSKIRETDIQLKKSIVSARELREKVETSIGELYSPRPINIMGCVS